LKRERPLRERALALLARREHARSELEAKLARYTDDAEAITTVIAELVRAKLLSDERYAEARSHVLSRKFGVARIVHELKRKGLDADLVERVTVAVKQTELASARAAWQKRFGVLATSAKERAQQMRFLQSRGFSSATIRALMRGPDSETDS
jgi:regulatory protein